MKKYPAQGKKPTKWSTREKSHSNNRFITRNKFAFIPYLYALKIVHTNLHAYYKYVIYVREWTGCHALVHTTFTLVWLCCVLFTLCLLVILLPCILFPLATFSFPLVLFLFSLPLIWTKCIKSTTPDITRTRGAIMFVLALDFMRFFSSSSSSSLQHCLRLSLLLKHSNILSNINCNVFKYSVTLKFR